jgi:hypothetical protein
MKVLKLTLFAIIFSTGVFAQAAITETQKIDEFGAIHCCDFGARVDYAAITQRANPGSQIYVVFYDARNAVRGQFRGFVRGFKMRALFQKVDMRDIVITNGGFRKRLTVEMWIVPPGAEPPKPTPTVNRKNVRYWKSRLHFSHVCDQT